MNKIFDKNASSKVTMGHDGQPRIVTAVVVKKLQIDPSMKAHKKPVPCAVS